MFESISIPRKVNNADVNEAFPFKIGRAHV